MPGNPLGSRDVGFGGEGMGIWSEEFCRRDAPWCVRRRSGGGGGLQQMVDLLYEVDFVDGAGVEGLLAEGLLDGLERHWG
mgnify:CR=1 FL=1